MGPKGQYFRANTGLVVLNRDGEILSLERIDIPGAWQLPQGGIEHDEEPINAAWRELEEETGITSEMCQVVGEYPEWLAYELPPEARSKKTGRGQVQRWFIFRFLGDDSQINLVKAKQEFARFEWKKAPEILGHAVDFRRPIYEKVVTFLDAENLI